MRVKSIGIIVAGFCLFAFAPVTPAAPQTTCDLPQDLHREIVTKYPGKRVVTLSDLQEDDRGFFQADHGNSCPGLVSVDFYGDGKPTLALVLTASGGTNQNAQLVGAHQVGGSLPPGSYHDVYGKRTMSDETSYCFLQVRILGPPLCLDRKSCQQNLDH